MIVLRIWRTPSAFSSFWLNDASYSESSLLNGYSEKLLEWVTMCWQNTAARLIVQNYVPLLFKRIKPHKLTSESQFWLKRLFFWSSVMVYRRELIAPYQPVSNPDWSASLNCSLRKSHKWLECCLLLSSVSLSSAMSSFHSPPRPDYRARYKCMFIGLHM